MALATCDESSDPAPVTEAGTVDVNRTIFAYVANADSNSVTTFSIDPDTGEELTIIL